MTREKPLLDATPLEPTKETISEMSLGAALRRAVDDLFTYRAIGEKVQAMPPNDVLDALVETWKQGLTSHLQGEAQSTVDNIAATLDLLQSGEALATLEASEWQQVERWYAPFPVATICREDLRGLLPDADIAQLSDVDMSQIAVRLGDTVHNSSDFRRSLAIATRSVLDEKLEPSDQSPEPKPMDAPPED